MNPPSLARKLGAIPFLAETFAARAAQHDRAASFPAGNFAKLREHGLLALTAPQALGGEGAGLLPVTALIETLGGACASTALVLAMQLIHLHVLSRNPNWPEALRAQVIETVVREGALLNALRVEPALGSPSRGGMPETIARRDGDSWRLSGRKLYSTGAPGLSWMLVWARTDEAEPRAGLFAVPARRQGVTIVETWDQLGLRASGSHDVVFDSAIGFAADIRLPAAWQTKDQTEQHWLTLVIAALYTGVAGAARNWLLTFLRERVPANLGAPLATLPRVQEAVGEIEALLATNRRLIASAAADHDSGNPPSAIECGLIKTTAAENAIEVVQRAVKLTSNHGLARANPLERHLRDVLCARIHTPQADAAAIAAGRLALSL